jgi:hypothetical protein
VRASRHWHPDWNWHERLARIRCMLLILPSKPFWFFGSICAKSGGE